MTQIHAGRLAGGALETGGFSFTGRCDMGPSSPEQGLKLLYFFTLHFLF